MGQGAYSISNALAEIGLKLLIPIKSSTSKDKATATITSLPPERVGLPNQSSVPSSSGSSPSGVPTASGLRGAPGPVAAAGVPAPSPSSSPAPERNGAGISNQAQSGVILTPAGWQNEDYLLRHP